MKKIYFIIGLGFATLLLTGCNGNVTRNLRHAGFNLSSEEFTCSTLLPASNYQQAKIRNQQIPFFIVMVHMLLQMMENYTNYLYHNRIVTMRIVKKLVFLLK